MSKENNSLTLLPEEYDVSSIMDNDHHTNTGNGKKHRLNLSSSSSSSSSVSEREFHYKHILYRLWRYLVWMPPLFGGLLIPFTLLSLYCWSVLNRQVDPFLPYISEVGTLTPQAAFFSMALDCLALLDALTFFIRYKQLKYQIRQIKNLESNFVQILHGINWFSVGSGYVHCGFMFFIGNFRAREWQALHLLAAVCSFFVFFVYATGSTYVLEYVHRSGQESPPTTMKASILLMILSMMGAFGTLLLSFWIVGSDVYDPNEGLQWNTSALGDTIHDISAIFQWIIFHSVALHLLCISRRIYKFKYWSQIKFTQ